MTKTPQKGRVPLERALSKLGLLSRTEARQLIELGGVKVHGSVETNPFRMVNPDTAHIEVSGQKAKRGASQLFSFHKPKGVVTTKRDPEGRKTIYDFLPENLQTFHAVGRLDMHTTGLLLLTNDSKISHFLTDPINEIPRIYIVGVRGKVSSESLNKMVEGIRDEGEFLRVLSADAIKLSERESILRLSLAEGKNREVRRLCGVLGHEVQSLKRVSFGPYELGDLPPGETFEVDINRVHLLNIET